MNESQATRAELESVQRLMVAQQPAEALEHCQRLAQKFPEDVNVQGMLASIYAALGKGAEAHSILQGVIQRAPDYYRAHEDLGLLLLKAGKAGAASAALQRATELNPDDLRTRLGLARALLADRKFEEAGVQCRFITDVAPGVTEAYFLLGCSSRAIGDLITARQAFSQVLSRVPDHQGTHLELAATLEELDDLQGAIEHYRKVAAVEPDDAEVQRRLAQLLAATGDSAVAAEHYRRVLQRHPTDITALLGVGHMAKTLGNPEEAIAAYQQAMDVHPDNGDVYQSLANMKNYVLSDEHIARMQASLEEADSIGPSQISMCFALGKAWDDRQQYEKAWDSYSQGNSARRSAHAYDTANMTSTVDRLIDVFTPKFFAARVVEPKEAAPPLFIVGMPRAGSTLVEQILSSHSQVEATRELPIIPRLCRSLRSNTDPERRYPELVSELNAADIDELAAAYLNSAAVHRHQQARYFIDKMPGNFMHVGMIHLLFPGARIIDVQRDAMDVCVANLRHHFSRGQDFAYGEADVAHYYLQYRRMMAHWDSTLPGRVTQVQYEDLVAGGSDAIDALLDAIGLPLESACHRFYEQQRPIHTASSEQVRQPVYSSAVGYWKNYEPSLSVLKAHLFP